MEMKVKTIPAKPIFDVPLPRKVAAYCRVSTNQEIQHHSLEVQKDYFKKLRGFQYTNKTFHQKLIDAGMIQVCLVSADTSTMLRWSAGGVS